MERFLITYGADNDMVTFDADSPAHAVEQFIDWAPVAPDAETNRSAITGVHVLVAVNPVEEGIGYAHSGDGSWFGLDALEVTFVPEEVAQDADDVEDYLFNGGMAAFIADLEADPQ